MFPLPNFCAGIIEIKQCLHFNSVGDCVFTFFCMVAGAVDGKVVYFIESKGASKSDTR